MDMFEILACKLTIKLQISKMHAKAGTGQVKSG